MAGGGQAIYKGNGGALTTVVDTSGQFSSFTFPEISINSAGTVAFLSSLDLSSIRDEDGGRVSGVYTVSGDTITTIADTIGDFDVGTFGFRGVSINDAGTVAFFGEGEDDGQDFSGVYAGQGGSLTTIVEHRASSPDDVPQPDVDEPSINNLGQVAFFGFSNITGGRAIFVGDGTNLTQLDIELGLSERFLPERRCPITDTGMVAFSTVDFNESLYRVYKYSDGEAEQIVEASRHGIHDLSDVMINEAGAVAFGGSDYPYLPRVGIFTGPDPVADKVIGYGDLIDGSPARLFRFWGQGLNDRGQVAFFASTDAVDGIYLATPVPEPATGMLGLGAMLLVYLRGWHRLPQPVSRSDKKLRAMHRLSQLVLPALSCLL